MSEVGEVNDANKVIGPFDKIKSCESENLRLPKNSNNEGTIPGTNVEEETNETNTSENKQEELIKKCINSKLNVNAAEFIPQADQNLGSVNYEDEYQDYIIYFKDVLQGLILNPGSYDEIFQPLCKVIKSLISDNNALEIFISVIIDECILEPNLRYSGARICSSLTDEFGSQFRNILLTRCQDEYRAFLENTQDSHDVNFEERIQGFAMFLAELFLQITVDGKTIPALGQGLLKILQKILLKESEKGVKSVCQILKLTGGKLERISQSKSDLDKLFDHLKTICNYVDVDPNLMFIIRKVLNMRASNWGEISEEEQELNEPVQVPESQKETEFSNDPVFFGPDGKIITEEETSFLQESVPLSEESDEFVCDEEEMSDEINEHYKDFLKTTPLR